MCWRGIRRGRGAYAAPTCFCGAKIPAVRESPEQPVCRKNSPEKIKKITPILDFSKFREVHRLRLQRSGTWKGRDIRLCQGFGSDRAMWHRSFAGEILSFGIVLLCSRGKFRAVLLFRLRRRTAVRSSCSFQSLYIDSRCSLCMCISAIRCLF